MKYILFLLLTITISCNHGSYSNAPEAINAASEFIDGCLKGNFQKADFYMLKDAENAEGLNKIKEEYQQKDKEELQKLKDASIIINADETVNDSTHIINYRYSFNNTMHKVKAIKQNDKWLVDFTYSFNGNL
jgi:hypothetical protein